MRTALRMLRYGNGIVKQLLEHEIPLGGERILFRHFRTPPACIAFIDPANPLSIMKADFRFGFQHVALGRSNLKPA